MKKMKKALAAMMAASMVMSVNMTAWAAQYDDMEMISMKKQYESAHTENGSVSPKETFAFTVKEGAFVKVEKDGLVDMEYRTITDADGDVTYPGILPKVADVTYEAGEAGSDQKLKEIDIQLPQYTRVGVYYYTIEETKNNTAGVTYYENPICLKVTVIEQDGRIRVAAVHTEEGFNGEGEGKKDTIVNTYSAGSLAITKTVVGNMGDHEKKFKVNVTFEAKEGLEVKGDIYYGIDTPLVIKPQDWENNKVELTIELKHNETMNFMNIPYGVTYTVEEHDYSSEGYQDEKYTVNDETLSTLVDDAIVYTGKVDKEEMDQEIEKVEIENCKEGEVDTGINLDSMPYIILLAVAAMGIFTVVAKKRDEDLF